MDSPADVAEDTPGLCTAGLHPMTPDNIIWRQNEGRPAYRCCKACRAASHRKAELITAEREQLARDLAPVFEQIRPRGNWTRNAACRGEDPELFFPERPNSAQAKKAKAVCARCPDDAKAHCLIDALSYSDTVGVHGGLVFPAEIPMFKEKQ